MPLPELESAAPTHPGLVSVDGRTYPLESAKLTARAEGGLAFSRLTQNFANPHDEALEVVYTMPLPAEGAVVGYTIRIGERVIRGVVEPREKADAAFRKALAQGHSAGLLEQDRDDTFQQRLGNIRPRTKVTVEIQVLQRLASLAATDSIGVQWEYRFPTVVGVRYEGAPGRVPDANRLDVDRDAGGGIPTRLEIDIHVADPSAKIITSPSHFAFCDHRPDGTHVRFAEGERLDRDLVIRWPACTDITEARLVTGGGLEGDDGRYGLLTVTPPSAPAATLARDLTVLLDASGSMTGEPIEYAKQVVRELLYSLEPGDRFELLAFANDVKSLTGGMKDAKPEAIRRAHEALLALRASGGTEMVNAIRQALKPLRKDSQRQVVLVTDGQIGFESEVLARIKNELPDRSRVHTVGIGSAPNRSLTAGAARAGRGVELLANDFGSTRESARRLCAATSHPVLTDVSIRGSALRRAPTTRPTDVFTGQPLLAAVELQPGGGTLEVRGSLAGSREPWVRQVTVPPTDAPTAEVPVTPLPIGALFGRETIADLELTLAASGHADRGLEEQIELFAMRHRIVSRRTSLVAIAEEPSVDPQAPKRVERLALELPAGVSAEGTGLLYGSLMTTFMAAASMPCLKEDRRATYRLSARMSSVFDMQRTGAPGRSIPVSDGRMFVDMLRRKFDRIRRELKVTSRSDQEGPPPIRIAAEELIGNLHQEWKLLDELKLRFMAESMKVDEQRRVRVIELLERLRSNMDRMRQMAEVANHETKEWVAGRAVGELDATLTELEQQGVAFAAALDELLALLPLDGQYEY